MLAVLILGSSSVLGGFVLPSAASAAPARSSEVRAALHHADFQTKSPFNAPVEDAASNSRTVCTVRVLRADPRIDPGIVKQLERPVDQDMVAPSVCAK
jgi:hypothetical protein